MLIFVKYLDQTLRTGTISARTTLHTQALGYLRRSSFPPLLFSVFPVSLLSRLLSPSVTEPAGSSPAHLSRDLILTLHQERRRRGMVDPHQGVPVTHQGTLVPDPGQLHLEAADESLNAEAGVD